MKPVRRRVALIPPDTIALSYAMELEKGIDRAFAKLKQRFDADKQDVLIAERWLKAIAEKFFFRASEHNRRDLARVLGVDIFKDDQTLQALLEAFVKENVSLIQNTASDLAAHVAEEVSESVRKGETSKTLGARLEERLNISKRHARLIARDQISKAYSDISQHRQEDAGIIQYKWRTAQDSRVRDDHKHREGKVFSWSNPPADGHPGKAILCRCYAEPILPDD